MTKVTSEIILNENQLWKLTEVLKTSNFLTDHLKTSTTVSLIIGTSQKAMYTQFSIGIILFSGYTGLKRDVFMVHHTYMHILNPFLAIPVTFKKFNFLGFTGQIHISISERLLARIHKIMNCCTLFGKLAQHTVKLCTYM